MIDKIEVKNFRGLDSLEVSNLTNINVFVGQNGCGKTSLLEAIFLASAKDHCGGIIHLSNMRGLILNFSNIHTYFNHFDVNKEISIMLSCNNNPIKLSIKPRYKDYTEQIISGQQIGEEQGIVLNQDIALNYDNPQNDIIGLNFIVEQGSYRKEYGFYIKKEEKEKKMYYSISDKTTDKQFIMGVLIPSNNVNSDKRIIDEIRRGKKEEELIKYLSIFDNNITDIEVNGGEIMLDMKNFPKRINVNIMGEGFKRYLSILQNFITNKFQCIMIDEIENGLHFTSMKKLIKSIIKLCKINGTQLFIATHSLEFLEILNNVAYEEEYKDIAIFNIVRAKKDLKLRSYRYDIEGLDSLLSTKAEIRD